MPYRTTREWVPALCLRCGEEIRDAKKNRKWCEACRPWAKVGYLFRQLLLALDRVGDAEDAAAQLGDLRERLNVGEDLFPLDGAMSMAQFALRGGGPRIPRDHWAEVRAEIDAARREVVG